MLFRGRRELAAEARPGRVPFDGGGVHRGFAELYEAARIPRCPPVCAVAGHSLGGVFAVLYALALARAGHAPPAVYTFGAPRLGDAALAARVARRAYRVANAPDVVPRLPPLCEHAGELVLARRHAGSVFGDHALAAYERGLRGWL